MRKAYSYIRMSTDIQLKGDSLRRQLKETQTYANENNLQLVDTIDGIPFKDIGVSAYCGVNAKEGALGVFLKALREGRIEPDSVLLAESLDRLSRDSVLAAFSQFSEILMAGIEIVTTQDGQKYTKESVSENPGQIFASIGVMFRSNNESLEKSKRIRKAWSNKRANAAQKPLTRICPAWLKLNEQLGCYVQDEARVQVVRKIFELCISTCGLYGIAKYLNENGVPVFGSGKNIGKMWYRSYIQKIITNRAVLGEFQAHQMVGKKREPCGEIIYNYFPRIIDDETFILANSALQRRNVSGKGRKGANFSNLFSGLVFCGSCGATMSCRNRGNLPKGGKSLCCSNKLVSAGCEMSEWDMSDFECYMFNHLKEVDFTVLTEETMSATTVLENELEVLKSKLVTEITLRTQLENLISNNYLNPEALSSIAVNLNSKAQNIESIKSDITACERNLAYEKEVTKVFESERLRHILELLDANKDDYFLRSSVNQILCKAIGRITLLQEHEKFPNEYEENDAEVMAYRELNPKFADTDLFYLVKRRDFQRLALEFRRHITVKYNIGTFREIRCGFNKSINSKRARPNSNRYKLISTNLRVTTQNKDISNP